MDIITPAEFLKRREEFFKKIKKGVVFIYPTDTIYGIGCDARNRKAVEDIRRIKKRPGMPFSVIVPSKQWIKEQCIVHKKAEEWLKKLPGPYTLILPWKENNGSNKTLGVRIPKHWISKIVKELGIPIITTSVNNHGKPPLTHSNELSSSMAKKVDFFINEGRIQGRSSTLINLTEGKASIKKR